MPAAYHLMSVAEKQAYARSDLSPPPSRCPHCGTAVQPRQLVEHVRKRCPGQPPIHKLEPWITYRRAIEIGIADETLKRLARNRTIRSRPKKRGRGAEYLESDISRYLARRERPRMVARKDDDPC
jgi:hypothetical protein